MMTDILKFGLTGPVTPLPLASFGAILADEVAPTSTSAGYSGSAMN